MNRKQNSSTIQNPSKPAFFLDRLRVITLVMSVVFCFSCFGWLSNIGVNAAFDSNAILLRDQVNVRVAASTTAQVITSLPKGTKVKWKELVQSSDPLYKEWVAIDFERNGQTLSGFVVASFLEKTDGGTTPTESGQSSPTLVPTLTPTPTATPVPSATASPTVAPTVTPEMQPIAPAAQVQSVDTMLAAFPESYRPGLRALLQKHPNWVFKPVNVSANWSSVVAAESQLGMSLIENSVNDAWKSTESKAYNWLTNTYTPYDSGTWVNASSDLVAYYLDPRNLMGEPYIFQFLNLSFDSSTQTAAAVQTILNNSFMATTKIKNSSNQSVSYAQTFMDAANAAKASPYFLASRVLQEVGRNGSNSTSGVYAGVAGTDSSLKGYYNFFNIGAYSSSDPVRLGLIFARYGSNNPSSPMSASGQATYLIPWNSPYRSLVGGSKYVAKNYINAGQYTLYLQKFDVMDDGNGVYWHQYMTNIRAMNGESSTMYQIYSNAGILDVPLVFSIPVYQNMPAAAVPKPAQKGNPNNWLKTLAVDGYSLTPTFNPATTDGYALIVPNSLTSVRLSASTVATTSQIAGTGAATLKVGDNWFPITVTAQNGSQRVYKLKIVRQGAAEVDSDLFKTALRADLNGKTLAGVQPGTTVAGLKSAFSLKNGAALSLYNAAGQALSTNDSLVGSGTKVRFTSADGKTTIELNLIIYGDINGDGKISSSDLTLLARQVLKQAEIVPERRTAADVNHDGKLSSSDLTLIARHVLKQSILSQ